MRAKQTIFHGNDLSFITSSTRLSRLECFGKLAQLKKIFCKVTVRKILRDLAQLRVL